MDPLIDQSLAAFDPISLAALNGKAEMLTRLDNKYIVSSHRLQPAIVAFAELFDVLEIDGKRAFSYSTRYFDDAERRGYYDHLQRRRKRGKVRVRDYLDSGFSYLEIKLKGKRSMTLKHRLSVINQLPELDDECATFIDDRYRDCYDTGFSKPLLPALTVDYERITLVAKEGGERMTIDTALAFRAPDAERLAPSHMFIVETKSTRGNGIADKIMRSRHIQPTKHASKYCIGMAATGQVTRRNNFLSALRRLGLGETPLSPDCLDHVSIEPSQARVITESNFDVLRSYAPGGTARKAQRTPGYSAEMRSA
jgi:VTC domain